jgi:magnesium transporter
VILFNRIERLNKKVANLRDSATQVRESYEAQIGINTNDIMRIFTVITAIFSALSLIVGWYGMNFTSMPEFQWSYGYSFVIVLSVSVVTICILVFKKKKFM